MAVTTQAQGTTVSPTKTDPQPVRRQGEGETAGVATLAFESLLDSSRTLIRFETHRAEKISPAQMFEAPVAEGGDPRAASLEEQQRSNRLEARRGNENSPSDVAARRSTFARPQNAQAQASTTNPTTDVPRAIEKAAAARLRVSSSDARPASPSLTQSNLDAERSAISQTRTAGSSRGNYSAPEPQGTPRPALAGATTVGLATASTPNVAQQVGELLIANRGGMESGHGVSSASAVSDGRSTATSPKLLATKAEHTPQSQGSAQPSEDTATKEATSFERLVRSIRLQTGTRNSSARLQLHPPELGRLRVDVRLAGDQIEIDVRTETDAARDAVSRRVDELKAALEQHGIQVNRFAVTAHAAPEQYAGTATYDGSSVPPDAQRNPSRASGRRRSGGERTDDGGSSAAMRAASTTATAAEARLDIRV